MGIVQDIRELEEKLQQKIKELNDFKDNKSIEDMLVVKLKVNTEEIKSKETVIQKIERGKADSTKENIRNLRFT
jgi:ribosome-binding protein aMBF1 (putative translation factor)